MKTQIVSLLLCAFTLGLHGCQARAESASVCIQHASSESSPPPFFEALLKS
ncbi:MAG: hypothetical protein ACE366_02320 [Bradymonadia bacterium]